MSTCLWVNIQQSGNEIKSFVDRNVNSILLYSSFFFLSRDAFELGALKWVLVLLMDAVRISPDAVSYRTKQQNPVFLYIKILCLT